MAKTAQAYRSVAVDILHRCSRSDAFVDHLMAESDRWNALRAQDKARCASIVSGVLRNKTRLDLVLAHYVRKGYHRQPALMRAVLRSALYELTELNPGAPWAVVSDHVSLSRKLFDPRRAGFVNGVLRAWLRTPYAPAPPASEDLQRLAVWYSHPEWLVRRFAERFSGVELEAVLSANNRVPSVYVRALERDLAVANLGSLEPVDGVPDSYRMLPGTTLDTLPDWSAGTLIVQDPAASLVADLAAPAEGMRVIDLCAAPGGKMLCLARRSSARDVVAVEKSARRLPLLHENLRRTGTTGVSVIEADATEVELPEADIVLVDAPCSGTGVLARRADLRWKRSEADFDDLIALQSRILDNASGLVKAGGSLIYGTCSLDEAENDGVTRAFHARYPGQFEIENASNYVDSRFVRDDGALLVQPHVHNGFDGAFAVRFKKKGK